MQIQEIFYSIQGEGMHIGRRAIFVRTHGCRKNCEFCDTRQTDLDAIEMSTDDITVAVLKLVETQNIRLVVITGGEPTEQPSELNELLTKLTTRSLEVHLETNGTGRSVQYAQFDHVTVSPKDNDIQLDALLRSVSIEFKLVANMDDEGAVDDTIVLLTGLQLDTDIPVTIQPMDNDSQVDLRDVEYLMGVFSKLIKDDPFKGYANIRYLPQLHKLVDIS